MTSVLHGLLRFYKTACFENNKKLLKSIKKRKETETAAGAKCGNKNGSRDPIAFDLAIYWLQ